MDPPCDMILASIHHSCCMNNESSLLHYPLFAL
ncbi:hypothetical protein KSS87_017311 [Heliosperma pusillum]|nr:hypothetical protein KSS87_017311 [Heliosperma pusillum]